MQNSNMGLASFGISFFVWCLLVTLGFPNLLVPIISLLFLMYALFSSNKGRVPKNREVLVLIIPILVIIATNNNITNLDVLRYLIWMSIGIMGITVANNNKNNELAYRIFTLVLIIVFISVLLQLISPRLFTTVIEPFIVNKDTFYYRYNQQHGIWYGIACDKGAANICGAVCIGIALWGIHFKKATRNKRVLIAAISIIVCAFSGARTSLVLIPLCLFLSHVLCTSEKKRVIAVFRGVLIATILLLAIWIIGRRFDNITAFRRIVETIESVYGESNTNIISSGRDLLYLAALNGISESPIFGHGWLAFNYSHVGIIDKGTASYVHNIILQLLYDTGVVGTVFFLVPFAYFLKKTISFARIISNNKRLELPSELKVSLYLQLYLIVDSILHVGLLDYVIIYIYMFSIALYYISRRKVQMRKVT